MTTQQIQNLKQLSPNALRDFVKVAAQNERDHLVQVLHGLQEIDCRRLFLEWGFSNLHQFCVDVLGYSEGSAARRVQASRLLKDLPEVKAKLVDGTLSLSVAAQAQTFFYREAKTASAYTPDQKREVLKALDHKTSRETERELLKLSPQSLPQEKIRQLTPEHQELRVILDSEMLAAVDEFRALASHQLGNSERITNGTQPASGHFQEVFRLALKMATESLRKKKLGVDRKPKTGAQPTTKGEAATAPKTPAGPPDIHNSTPTSEQNLASQSHLSSKQMPAAQPVPTSGPASTSTRTSRFIPVAVKRAVWERDGGTCAYVDPVTKRRCQSKVQLEFDHYPTPYAHGGGSTIENLRLACCRHNAYGAEKIFGKRSERRDSSLLHRKNPL